MTDSDLGDAVDKLEQMGQELYESVFQFQERIMGSPKYLVDAYTQESFTLGTCLMSNPKLDIQVALIQVLMHFESSRKGSKR